MGCIVLTENRAIFDLRLSLVLYVEHRGARLNTTLLLSGQNAICVDNLERVCIGHILC